MVEVDALEPPDDLVAREPHGVPVDVGHHLGGWLTRFRVEPGARDRAVGFISGRVPEQHDGVVLAVGVLVAHEP